MGQDAAFQSHHMDYIYFSLFEHHHICLMVHEFHIRRAMTPVIALLISVQQIRTFASVINYV